MKLNRPLLFLFALAASSSLLANVPPPQKRAEALQVAEQLLATRDPALPAGFKNPFQSEKFAELLGGVAATPSGGQVQPSAGGNVPVAPRSGRDLLAAVATGLRPSGFFVLGGVPTLVFGQKRVKAGDSLTINFEGNQLTVVITAISPPNFTFRLNNDEFTRPIK